MSIRKVRRELLTHQEDFGFEFPGSMRHAADAGCWERWKKRKRKKKKALFGVEEKKGQEKKRERKKKMKERRRTHLQLRPFSLTYVRPTVDTTTCTRVRSDAYTWESENFPGILSRPPQSAQNGEPVGSRCRWHRAGEAQRLHIRRRQGAAPRCILARRRRSPRARRRERGFRT